MVDRRLLVEVNQGHKDHIRGRLRRFVEELPEVLAGARAALDRGDAAGVKDCAHKAKNFLLFAGVRGAPYAAIRAALTQCHGDSGPLHVPEDGPAFLARLAEVERFHRDAAATALALLEEFQE